MKKIICVILCILTISACFGLTARLSYNDVRYVSSLIGNGSAEDLLSIERIGVFTGLINTYDKSIEQRVKLQATRGATSIEGTYYPCYFVFLYYESILPDGQRKLETLAERQLILFEHPLDGLYDRETGKFTFTQYLTLTDEEILKRTPDLISFQRDAALFDHAPYSQQNVIIEVAKDIWHFCEVLFGALRLVVAFVCDLFPLAFRVLKAGFYLIGL